MDIQNKLEELDNKMLTLNKNLSALIHIQKLKTLEEAKQFMMVINREIGSWIGEIRELKKEIAEVHGL